MCDVVNLTREDRLIVEKIANRRGISLKEAAQFLVCSDLDRNASTGVKSSVDVAKFRKGDVK